MAKPRGVSLAEARHDDAELEDEDVYALITDLERRFGGSETNNLTTVHGRIAWRRRHLGNLPEAAPQLPPHLNDGQKYQSDAPRRLYVRLMGRMLENHPVFRVKPMRDTANMRKRANKVETYLNSGLLFVEERMDDLVAGELASGILADCYGIVHWCKAEHIWPKVPEPEEIYELPDDPREAERYEPHPDDEGKPTRRYRKTARAQLEDRAQEKARAGWPWFVEVIDPISFMWDEDRSLENGFATCIVRRDVRLSEYMRRLRSEFKDDDDELIAPSQVRPGVPIYGPTQAPAWWEPNSSDWGERVRVYQVWTRDECYEVCAGTASAYGSNGVGYKRVVKSFHHPYGMPPFALAKAVTFPGSDPVVRYQPALEGVLRMKQVYDRAKTLFMVLSEEMAIPYYYWVDRGTGEAWTDSAGNRLTFRRDSALAEKAPPGYELAKIEFEINPAFVAALDQLKEELAEAAPMLGDADVTASTQPWAIRLQQQIASVEIGMYLNSIARALATMARNMMMVHSLRPEDGGFAGPAYVFARYEAGKIDEDNLVGIEREDVQSLNVRCDISNVSSAERITLVEHGRALLNDPKVPLTVARFLEEYMGDENPDETMAGYDAEQIFELFVKPGLLRIKAAERWGSQVGYGPNGSFYSTDGRELRPEEVIAMRGGTPYPTSGPGPGAPAGVLDPASMGLTPGALPALTTPETVPLGGMVG